MARKSQGDIYVATTSFACTVQGVQYNVSRGERVREGHPLLKAHAGAFESLSDQPVQYDVEQATAAPGEKRSR